MKINDGIIITHEKKQISIGLIYIFLFNLLLIGISYGMLVRKHYSVDTYTNIFGLASMQNLQLGRVIAYFITRLFEIIDINPAINQEPFTLLFIITMAVCSTLLVKKICSFLNDLTYKTLIAILLTINLTFINVYILELYLFPEAIFLFTVGIITVTISILYILDSFSIKSIIISFVFLIISINTYQINISLFIIYALTILLLKSNFKVTKDTLKGLAIVLVIGFLTSLLNIWTLNILELLGLATKNSRSIVLSIESLLSPFKTLFGVEQIIVWIFGSGLMPFCSMLIFLIIAMILLASSIFKKVHIKSLLYIVLILLISYGIIFVPHMLTDTIWAAPRTLIGVFAFLSTIFLLIIKLNTKKSIINVAIASMALFILLNFFQIQDIVSNHISNNKIDKELITMINSIIVNYK